MASNGKVGKGWRGEYYSVDLLHLSIREGPAAEQIRLDPHDPRTTRTTSIQLLDGVSVGLIVGPSASCPCRVGFLTITSYWKQFKPGSHHVERVEVVNINESSGLPIHSVESAQSYSGCVHFR